MAAESWRIATLVQELADGVHEPPSRYVRREQDRPVLSDGKLVRGAADTPEPIPVIDLGRLSSAADGAEEAGKLWSALQGWGLFVVTNHGIETSLMDDVMNATREFFRQPLEEKQKCSNLIDGKHFQVEGYGNDQVKTQDQTMDWSDRLHLRVEPENLRDLANWPKHPESFRDVLLEYTLKSKTIKHIILGAMARLLELDENYFLNQFSDKVMSNGIFKSPVHRVVANTEIERTSLAMFYGLDPEKEIEPAADILHEKQPAQYRKVSIKDYMAGFYEHFARGTRVLDSMKI